ncbi:MAG: hypothetical protein PHQ86_04125 [Dehalococcoidales bacterium]|nr:hypothetical protein [Dehalococcoidales bacterium]
MPTNKPVGPEQLTLSTKYNAALQFYNSEFRTLGERTNIFLLSQSIFIAAIILLLNIYNNKNYEILTIPVMGIILTAILFCSLQIRAGRSGAESAFAWREYMLTLEKSVDHAPWQQFSKEFSNYFKFKDKKLGWIKYSGPLVECLPLPSGWFFTPLIFILFWIGSFIYILITYFGKADLCLEFWIVIILGLIILHLLFLSIYLLRLNYLAWQHPTKKVE